MRTSVTELPESRVRVDVDVDADAVERRVDTTAKAMGRELRIPGFRKGKVPAGLVVQRIGREAVLEQAVRDALGEWYERALGEAGVTPVGDPKLELGELPAEGQDLRFSIEIAVRPTAELGTYRGLEVGRGDVEVADDAIAAELDRLREALASLNPVERDAAEGDLVMIDYAGTVDGEPFDGGEARDLMVEVGGDGLLPEIDAALRGAAAGAELDVDVSFPAEYRPEELAGKAAKFAVTVKEVREKRLPELDDDFAAEASEFDTLDELRAAVAERLGEFIERRVEADFRDAAIDAAAAAARPMKSNDSWRKWWPAATGMANPSCSPTVARKRWAAVGEMATRPIVAQGAARRPDSTRGRSLSSWPMPRRTRSRSRNFSRSAGAMTRSIFPISRSRS